jgi:hypothetical protein
MKRATAITDERKNNAVLILNPLLNVVCSDITIRSFQYCKISTKNLLWRLHSFPSAEISSDADDFLFGGTFCVKMADSPSRTIVHLRAIKKGYQHVGIIEMRFTTVEDLEFGLIIVIFSFRVNFFGLRCARLCFI